MPNFENIVLVKSQTRLAQLKNQFNTLSNAKFYLERQNQGASFEDLQEEDYQIRSAIEFLHRNLEGKVNIKHLNRQYLPNYVFAPNDLILVVGQDGLVANTAKYAHNIPIIGVNPSPDRYDGVLLPFDQKTGLKKAFHMIQGASFASMNVTMAEAKMDDGQRLLAFNDLFIGPQNHSSARYIIQYRGKKEKQSSSGIIVSTGAGSTGWMSSMLNMAKGIQAAFGPSKNQTINGVSTTLSWDAKQLLFAVREPFKSKISGIDLVAGAIERENPLVLESQMPHNGVIFSDGIQGDFLRFTSGRVVTIGIAKEKALLVA